MVVHQLRRERERASGTIENVKFCVRSTVSMRIEYTYMQLLRRLEARAVISIPSIKHKPFILRVAGGLRFVKCFKTRQMKIRSQLSIWWWMWEASFLLEIGLRRVRGYWAVLPCSATTSYLIRSGTPEKHMKLALHPNFMKLGIHVLDTRKYDSRSGYSRSTPSPSP